MQYSKDSIPNEVGRDTQSLNLEITENEVGHRKNVEMDKQTSIRYPSCM